MICVFVLSLLVTITSAGYCTNKDNVKGCRMVWSHLEVDRPSKAGRNYLFKLTYMHRSSLSSNGFRGKLGIGPIMDCHHFRSGGLETPPAEIGGIKPNFVTFIPALRNPTLKSECGGTHEFFHYFRSEDGSIAIDGDHDALVTEYDNHIAVHDKETNVNFTTKGNRDPLMNHTGVLDATNFFKEIRSRVLIEGNPDLNFKVFSALTSSRRKRSLPRYKGETKDCSRLMRYFNAQWTLASRTCMQLELEYGSFWHCIKTDSVNHCYTDISGGWEDGGIHRNCLRPIVSFIQHVVNCGTASLAKFISESDDALLDMIGANRNQTTSLQAFVNVLRANLDDVQISVAENLEAVIEQESDITNLENFITNFTSSLGNWSESVDNSMALINQRMDIIQYETAVQLNMIHNLQNATGVHDEHLENILHDIHNESGKLHQKITESHNHQTAQREELATKTFATVENRTSELQQRLADLRAKHQEFKNESSQYFSDAEKENKRFWKSFDEAKNITNQNIDTVKSLQNKSEARINGINSNFDDPSQTTLGGLSIAGPSTILVMIIIIILYCVCCRNKNN